MQIRTYPKVAAEPTMYCPKLRITPLGPGPCFTIEYPPKMKPMQSPTVPPISAPIFTAPVPARQSWGFLWAEWCRGGGSYFCRKCWEHGRGGGRGPKQLEAFVGVADRVAVFLKCFVVRRLLLSASGSHSVRFRGVVVRGGEWWWWGLQIDAMRW